MLKREQFICSLFYEHKEHKLFAMFYQILYNYHMWICINKRSGGHQEALFIRWEKRGSPAELMIYFTRR